MILLYKMNQNKSKDSMQFIYPDRYQEKFLDKKKKYPYSSGCIQRIISITLDTLNLQNTYKNLPVIVTKLLEEPKNLTEEEKEMMRKVSENWDLVRAIQNIYNKKVIFSKKENIIDFGDYLKKYLEITGIDFDILELCGQYNYMSKSKDDPIILMDGEAIRLQKIQTGLSHGKGKAIWRDKNREIVKAKKRNQEFEISWVLIDSRVNLIDNGEIEKIYVLDKNGNEVDVYWDTNREIVEVSKWEERFEICGNIDHNTVRLVNGEKVQKVTIRNNEGEKRDVFINKNKEIVEIKIWDEKFEATWFCTEDLIGNEILQHITVRGANISNVFLNKYMEPIKITKWKEELTLSYVYYGTETLISGEEVQKIKASDMLWDERDVVINKKKKIVEVSKWKENFEICDFYREKEENIINGEAVQKVKIRSKKWNERDVVINKYKEIVEIKIWDKKFELCGIGQKSMDLIGGISLQNVFIRNKLGKVENYCLNRNWEVIMLNKWKEEVVLHATQGIKHLGNQNLVQEVTIRDNQRKTHKAVVNENNSTYTYIDLNWKEKYFDWDCDVLFTTDLSKPLFQKGITAEGVIIIDN